MERLLYRETARCPNNVNFCMHTPKSQGMKTTGEEISHTIIFLSQLDFKSPVSFAVHIQDGILYMTHSNRQTCL